MNERLRFVGAMDRVLYLRTLSELEGVPAGELVHLAEYGKERSFRPGETLLEEGELPSSFFILARGKVEVSSEGLVLGHAHARQPVGLIALIAGDENGIRARAVEEVLCLEFGAEVLRDTLEERFSIVHNLLRNSSRQLLDLSLRSDPNLFREDVEEVISCPARPLDLVERIALLRKAKPFLLVGLDALAEMAFQLEERRWEVGDRIFAAGEMGHRIEILVCGRVRCHDTLRDFDYEVTGGSALGVIEAYAGAVRSYEAVVEEHVVSLSTHSGTMIDLMEDHLDIATSSLALTARMILKYGQALARQAESDTD